MAIRKRHVEVAVVGILALLGCRERARARDASSAITLRVLLDGDDVARITPADLAARRSLADVLPADARDVATWQLVTATTDDGRSMILEDVATRYPGHAVTLYLDDHAQPTLALVPPIRADQPPHVQRALATPAIALSGITRIDVDRTAPVDDATAPRAELVVMDRGRETRFDAARLEALPRANGGWDLRDVLTAAGIDARATIAAIGREDRTTFARAELDTPTVRGTLRWNRRGQLRLGIDRTGAAVVVHDLVRLDVIPP